MPATQVSKARPAHRMRRLLSAAPARAVEATKYRPRDLFWLSAFLGLATGWLELALVIVNRPIKDSAPLFFRANRNIVWSIPLVDLLLFLALGVAFILSRRLWQDRFPRLQGQAMTFVMLAASLQAIPGLHAAAAVGLALGLAIRVQPWCASRWPQLAKLSHVGAVGLGIAALGAGAATAGRERWSELSAARTLPAAPRGAPNVLLIVLDTVRADHMSIYGYERDTTPQLRRWFANGTRFDRAYSAAPWTLPSHASLLTGLWPHEHRAGLHRPLDEEPRTVAEALRELGYATAGFVANTIYCSAETGLDRGFNHYEDHLTSPRELLRTTTLGRSVLDKLLDSASRCTAAVFPAASTSSQKHFKSAAMLNTDALAWLDGQPRDRPFFMFLNYFDAHHPYIVPDTSAPRFGAVPRNRSESLLLHRWWDMDKRRATDRERALALDGYDDCLHYLDSQLGVLFDALEMRGVLKDTLVIVTSDHGEHFGEHGLFGHAGSLYGPEVHVPLLIRDPRSGAKGAVVEAPVSNRDIAATIADSAGVAEAFPGQSLTRFQRASSAAESAILTQVEGPPTGPANAGRSPVFRGAMSAVIRGDLMYILNGDSREELYDVAADPLQNHNLIGTDANLYLPELRALHKGLTAPTRSPANTVQH